MKFKIILLLAALLLVLSYPALSGPTCGSNWLGTDSNDQDFYVSNNQNLGASSGVETPAVTAKASQPSIKLGQSANADSSSVISSLTPDKPSPQGAGTAITWTASSDRKDLLFKFFLKGPATDDQLAPKTNWTTSNVWIWNTTASDKGDSQVEVRVRDGKHAGPDGFDDRLDASFTIAAPNAEDTTSSLSDDNSHPPSRTGSADSIKTKPRIAPDERRSSPLSAGNPNGPNMNMPDPSPKPLGSAASADNAATGGNNGQNGASITSESRSPAAMPADIGGKWLVELDGSKESMELILIQTGSSIMGSGSLIGETKIPLVASGSLDEDKLKLNVKTVVGKYVNQIDKHYEMDLMLANGAISGSYQAYSGENTIGNGHAAATRSGT